MPEFRYVCERHQALFVEFTRRGGCEDPAQQEKVRRRLLRWLSEAYPALVLEQFNAHRCIGCGLEAACVDLDEVRLRTQKSPRRRCARPDRD